MNRLISFFLIAIIMITITACSGGYESIREQREQYPDKNAEIAVNNVKSNIASEEEVIQTEQESDENLEENEPILYGIGEAGSIGNFSFTINEVLELPALGNESSEGKFIVVEIKAENIGKEPDAVSENFFKLIDDQDRIFKHYDYYFVEGLNSFSIDGINPGLSKTGHVVFEVPADTTILALAATDSMFDFGNNDYVFFNLYSDN